MLGRGAVTRPDLIARIDTSNNVDKDDKDSALSWQALIPHQISFLYGEAKNDIELIGRYKQWLAMLTKGYSEAQALWQEIKREKDKATIIHALQNSMHA